MTDFIERMEQRLASAESPDDCADATLDLIGELGFTCLIYDYTPVPLSHAGELITPSVLSFRNAPEDMRSLWCDQGYYQHDPVQQLALATTTPFVWSYSAGRNSTPLARHLNPDHAAVSSYLHDMHLTCGITVPVHRRDGDLATFTAIRDGGDAETEHELRRHLGTFSFMGHLFHQTVLPMFSEEERRSGYVSLTRRERECLRYSAEGLTAKEIARRLDRAVPTVTLHLNSAVQKLGARNRVHAVALASHYRLLDA